MRLPTCLNKNLLVKSYDALHTPLRATVHYRTLAIFGKPFNYFLTEEPWRVYEVLEKAVGRHGAELVINIFADWLRRNGCNVTQEELRQVFTPQPSLIF